MCKSPVRYCTAILTFMIGLSLVSIWHQFQPSQQARFTPAELRSELIPQIQKEPSSEPPRFRLLRRDFNSYEFLSSGGELRFDNGANISILHNFVDSEGLRLIFAANCKKKRKGQSIKRSYKSDESGQNILHRCVIVEHTGKTRIIWNESKTEYWTIDATSLSLGKEFENSDAFSLVKYWESSKQY